MYLQRIDNHVLIVQQQPRGFVCSFLFLNLLPNQVLVKAGLEEGTAAISYVQARLSWASLYHLYALASCHHFKRCIGPCS